MSTRITDAADIQKRFEKMTRSPADVTTAEIAALASKLAAIVAAQGKEIETLQGQAGNRQ
jgi:hypothetical protein